MLIDVYCLRGDPARPEEAEIAASLRERQVREFDDILPVIGSIYADVKSPCPIIGNVRAEANGFLIPTVGRYFFWVVVSDPRGAICLDDFGSSATCNRVSVLDGICRSSFCNEDGIWEFEKKWTLTHHRTRSERLIAYYVSYVQTRCGDGSYREWLGADGFFAAAPFDETRESRFYAGIDMRRLDTSNVLKGRLEAEVFLADGQKRTSQAEQNEIRIFVAEYLAGRKINPAARVNDGPAAILGKDEEIVSAGRYESIRSDILQVYAKRVDEIF